MPNAAQNRPLPSQLAPDAGFLAELTKQIAANVSPDVTSEEEAQNNKSADSFGKLSIEKKTVPMIVFWTVDFLERLWYNTLKRMISIPLIKPQNSRQKKCCSIATSMLPKEEPRRPPDEKPH